MIATLLAPIALAPRLQIQSGHQATVTCIDVRGGTIALGSADRTASLYDAGGKQLLALGGPVGRIHEVCIVEGGRFVATRADSGSPGYFPEVGFWSTSSARPEYVVPDLDKWLGSETESDYFVNPRGLFIRGEKRYLTHGTPVPKSLPGVVESVDREGSAAVIRQGQGFAWMRLGGPLVALPGATGRVYTFADGAVSVDRGQFVRYDTTGKVVARRTIAGAEVIDCAASSLLVYGGGRLELLGPNLRTALQSDPRAKPTFMRVGQLGHSIDAVATTTGFAEYRAGKVTLRTVGRPPVQIQSAMPPAWSQGRSHVAIPITGGVKVVKAGDGSPVATIRFAADTRAVFSAREGAGLMVCSGQAAVYFDLEVGRPTWTLPNEEPGFFGPDWGQRSTAAQMVLRRASGWEVVDRESGSMFASLTRKQADWLEASRSGNRLVGTTLEAVLGWSLEPMPKELWRLPPIQSQALDVFQDGWLSRYRQGLIEWFDLDVNPPRKFELRVPSTNPWDGPWPGPGSPSGNLMSYLAMKVTPTIVTPDQKAVPLEGMANTYSGFSPKGTYYYGTNPSRDTWIWRTADGKLVREIYAGRDAGDGFFTQDERAIYLPKPNGEMIVVDLPSGQDWTLPGHEGRVLSISQIASKGVVVTRGAEGSVKLWRDRRELCTIVVDPTGRWVVIAPDGRFDTNRPEAVEFLQWVVDDGRGLRSVPIETYLREYFEPFLLRKLLDGETLSALPPIRPRAAPMAPQVSAPLTSVDGFVTVKATLRQPLSRLVLLRDGAVVSEISNPKPNATFKAIRIAADSTLTVYGFDADGLKTANVVSQVSYRGKPIAKRAWIFMVGIDRYADPSLKLSWASADAEQVARALSDRMRGSGSYAGVESHVVTSNNDDVTVAKVQEGFRWLARHAGPRDVAVIAWSGHGMAQGSNFVFLTSESTKARPVGISSDNLRQLMLPIDAGRLLLALDTCYAAATIDVDGFRPGPLGGRSFGQTAYDKAMFVVSATQSNAPAIESGSLGHGLLSFALLEGLEQRSQATFTETFIGAANRVPNLFRRVIEGASRAGSTAVPKIKGTAQRAAIFDFRAQEWGRMY